MRAEHDIEMRKGLGELLPVALSDAAADSDDALRQRRFCTKWNVLHGGDLAVEARISCLSDAAGHEDDDIGFLNGFYHECSERFEHACYALRIVFIHLTSEGVDAERKPIDG